LARAATLSLAFHLGAIGAIGASAQQATKVGPARGAVMVVGGGAQGPELYARFIELAGGPDALIIDVPTAGGDSVYPADWRGTRGLRAAGARNVVVLHTLDRKVADSDSFTAPIRRAGAVWFEGGRQWRLVDAYAGTRTEGEFHDVLARGGVVGGSSAGASILSSYMVRGARAGNTTIMAPDYEAGFGFLRGVAIDQHVVARERLRDLADSLMPRHPELLGISEDEGTAWVVRGDTAEIIGRNKAFVYGGRDPTDSGAPFLTLRPGDRYDLARRRVTHRAIDDSPLTLAYVDSLFARGRRAGAMATILVARGGKVLVNRSYGVPPQPRYMPTTTLPNFSLGELSDGFNAIAAQLVAREGRLSIDDPIAEGTATARELLSDLVVMPDGASRLAELLGRSEGLTYPQLIERRIFAPIGAHKTLASAGQLQSNVDELYRFALALEAPRTLVRDTVSASDSDGETPPALDTRLGWRVDRYRGMTRLAEYSTTPGSHAFVRFPEQRAVVIILTSGGTWDARSIAERIADRVFFTGGSSRAR
jgi:cyanophycinase